MATWDEREIGTEQCPDCGALYEVTIMRLPLREEDDFECKCGYIMRSWNGTVAYSYKPKAVE